MKKILMMAAVVLTLQLGITACGSKENKSSNDSDDKEQKAEPRRPIDKMMALLKEGLDILENTSLDTQADVEALAKKCEKLKEKRNAIGDDLGEGLSDEEKATYEEKADRLYEKIEKETERMKDEGLENDLDMEPLRGLL